MKVTIPPGYSVHQPALTAITDTGYSKGDSVRSVTQLIDSPRIAVLREEEDDKIEIDLSEIVLAAMGTAVHKMIEAAHDKMPWGGPGEYIARKANDGSGHSMIKTRRKSFAEKRLFSIVNGHRISGAADYIRIDESIHENERSYLGIHICDWKTTRVGAIYRKRPSSKELEGLSPEYTYDVKPEWEKQLNLLIYLMNHPDGDHSPLPDTAPQKDRLLKYSLSVGVFLRDWTLEATTDPLYPKSPHLTLGVKVWIPEDAKRYVEERVDLHMSALHEYKKTKAEKGWEVAEKGLPPCTPEEMWESPDVFAVKKTGSKRATKLYDTAAEAIDALNSLNFPETNYELEVRRGERKRCLRYCPVRKICSIPKAFKEEMEREIYETTAESDTGFGQATNF